MKQLIKKLLVDTLSKKGYYLRRDILLKNSKRLKSRDIPGWFSEGECKKLYQLTLTTKGDIMEIGHFLGRSTACICEALEDSGIERKFYSYDLGISSAEDYKSFFGGLLDNDRGVPQKFKDFVFNKNMTTTQLAEQHLKVLGLDKYVKLITGNFIQMDTGKYDFIFCDAMHGPTEIKLNLPHVVNNSKHGCIWAFHDMNPADAELVTQLADCIFIEGIDSLGIFLYRGK